MASQQLPLLGMLLIGVGCASDPRAGLIVIADDPSDLPLAALSEELTARFDQGDALFDHVFREADGLGPLYIRHSCASCHEKDGRGPGAVTKMAVIDADGTMSADQSALPFGHTERPHLAAGATTTLLAPEAPDIAVTRRFGPPVFGRGYVEAIRDDEIERVEAEQATRDDGISGRINRVAWQSEANPDAGFHLHGPGDRELIGRFGLKARIATVDEFVADACQGDMGITSPLRPGELANPDGLEDDGHPGVDVDLETVNHLADYVRMLRIPERRELRERGRRQFEEVGCATCHVPRMRTRADYPIPALADVDAPIYSDLLLHDMGDALADGLVEQGASEREWKTTPLIGVRFLPSLLHDGRASDVLEAIEEHRSPGSEASASVDAFERLEEDDRVALIDFVESL